ncbi:MULTISPECIES: hypothetical protein [unclassified Roseitalea]|nr:MULTISPECIES: hypothetical protein [unclassified Roseitalea]
MDRNSRTPRLAGHYRPAPPAVWLLAGMMLAVLAGSAALYMLIVD